MAIDRSALRFGVAEAGRPDLHFVIVGLVHNNWGKRLTKAGRRRLVVGPVNESKLLLVVQ